MGGFDAALKIGSDTQPLRTRLEVEDGRLRIRAADQTIGDWSLTELDFERVSGGYRVEVEGEQMVLDVPDLLGFQEAINGSKPKTKKAKRARSKPDRPKASRPQRETKPKPPKKVKEAKEKTAKVRSEGSFLTTALAALDRGLEKAKISAGSDWPGWIFSRGTVGAVAALIILMLIFPGLFSTTFLLGGLVFVVVGAVLYTDDAMARRWLPGRVTALHVLIGGAGLAVLGVLVAVVRG